MRIRKQQTPFVVAWMLLGILPFGCTNAPSPDTQPGTGANESAPAITSDGATPQSQRLSIRGTPPPDPKKAMKIRFKLEGAVGAVMEATLDDNATSRDFLTMLPLTISLRDYAATEKIGDIPQRLSTEEAPTSITPLAGDITYYSPRGNLAFFYKGGRKSSGLVRLGRFNSKLDPLKHPGPLKVTIQKAQ